MCVKGGVWRNLIHNDVNDPSYYEVIDVILREISGTANKNLKKGDQQPNHGIPIFHKGRRKASVNDPTQGAADIPIVAIPFDAIAAATRRKYREEIQSGMYLAYLLVLVITGAVAYYGASKAFTGSHNRRRQRRASKYSSNRPIA
jgi:hypothetical protein